MAQTTLLSTDAVSPSDRAPQWREWVYQHFGPQILWPACGALGLLLWVGFALLSAYSRKPLPGGAGV